jgi:CheY-like chemotaxis protein
MPGMDGITAARILKGPLPKVRLILYTMYGDLVRREELQSAGISAVFSKVDPLVGPLGQSKEPSQRGLELFSVQLWKIQSLHLQSAQCLDRGGNFHPFLRVCRPQFLKPREHSGLERLQKLAEFCRIGFAFSITKFLLPISWITGFVCH